MSKKLIQAAAGAGGESVYVDDVFSTYLYTANNSAQGDGNTQTINNGLDLSSEGGLVWIKKRGDDARSHVLMDTERGATKALSSNSTAAERTDYTGTDGSGTGAAFTSTGFTVGDRQEVNAGSGDDFCSWSFRKQAGFFDIVKYTGNGTAGNTVSHNLGSVPGMIIVKRTAAAKDWWVYHVGSNNGNSPQNKYQILNAGPHNEADSTTAWNDTAPTATEFTLGTSTNVNANGEEHIAYLFANNDQSFGDNSDEAIVKCGHFSANGSGEADVDLGFEPQWIIFKRHNSSTDGDWFIVDNMRGWHTENKSSISLKANDTTVEAQFNIFLNSTGFTGNGFAASGAYIYTAIRRPMKTPEAGTEVFKPVAYTGNSTAGRSITCGFPLDVVWTKGRTAIEPILFSRLQGSNRKLLTYSTAAEASSGTNTITSFDQDGMTVGTDTDINSSSYTYVNHFFKRAKGFMDVVAYTGNASARALSHNLGVAPELLIFKTRSVSDNWLVASTASQTTMFLNLTNTDSSSNYSTKFTSFTDSVINLSASSSSYTNENNKTYVCYMFATLAGVSKCGIYTGTGAVNTIDCGFSSGARYVMIKSRDNARDWFVWDSARGIVAGNDPYLKYNATSGETSVDWIDPENSGFQLSGANDANQSGEKYIFLAIA